MLAVRHDHRVRDVPAHQAPPAAEFDLASVIRQIGKPIKYHQSVAPYALHLLTPLPRKAGCAT
jgi:hypothetical protein